jgi:hypothetical protein
MVIASRRTSAAWSFDDPQSNPDRAGFPRRRSRVHLGRRSRAAKERPPSSETLVARIDGRGPRGKATGDREEELALAAEIGGEIRIDGEEGARQKRNRQATAGDEAPLGLDSALRTPDY